jgi:hypothetical protein
MSADDVIATDKLINLLLPLFNISNQPISFPSPAFYSKTPTTIMKNMRVFGNERMILDIYSVAPHIKIFAK